MEIECKWSITIGKKKRGLWRPPITISIWMEEGGSKNPPNILNIEPQYKFPLVKDKEADRYGEICRSANCPSYIQQQHEIPTTPVSFFMGDAHRSLDFYFSQRCFCRIDGKLLFGELPSVKDIFKGYMVTLYPEWRPGVPDYVDIYEWLRDILVQPCVEEFNRRICEAMSSPETEPLVYTSDDRRLQQAVEETKKVSRRLKVA